MTKLEELEKRIARLEEGATGYGIHESRPEGASWL